MRIALLVPLLASIATACRASDDDTSRTAATDAAPDSSATTTPLAGAPSTPTLGGSCSAMARIARGTLRIAIGRDRATTFPAPRQSLGTWRGCRLVGNGVARPGGNEPAPDVVLQRALLAEGWTADPEFSAASAVGTEFAMRSVAALCVASIGYTAASPAAAPVAAAADSARPSAPYRLEIRCTEGTPPPR